MLASVVAAALSIPAVDLPPPPEPVWETEAEAALREGPSDRALRSRAIGLGVTSAIFGVGWLSGSALVASGDLGLARELDARGSGGCIDWCYGGTVVHPMLSPLAVAAAGLAGGALHAHGRWLARNDRGLARSPRAAKAMLGTGVGLIVGSGVALGVGLGMIRFTSTERGEVWLRGLAWGGSTAMLTAGAGLAGFGHGIHRGRRERGSRVAWSVAPMLGRTTGVAVGGRF